MSERGIMLGGETRFLTERQSGTLQGAILPDDTKAEGDSTRWGGPARAEGPVRPALVDGRQLQCGL